MAAEWLRADQVQAIAERHQLLVAPGGSSWCDCGAYPCDSAALATQDGRWRALVGALVGAADEVLDYAVMPATSPPSRLKRLRVVLAQAQAALADTPPAPRGPAAE